MEVFLTPGRCSTQPPLRDVVWQYDIFKEIDVSLTTRLDPLSANVPCDYYIFVTRKDSDKHSLLNFSIRGAIICAIPAVVGQGVTEQKRAQRKARIRRRIASVQWGAKRDECTSI